MCVSENLWIFLKDVKPLVVCDMEQGMAIKQCRGNALHLELIWCTPIYFALLRGHRYSSRLVTVILGILWSSVKEIEVPYVFDGEHGIPLHAMQGNRALSCVKGEVS